MEKFWIVYLTGVSQPAVKKLIQISRLDSILTVIPTPSEAVDYVYMDAVEKEMIEEE